MALPFRQALARVHGALADEGALDRTVLIGSGLLGLPANALLAFAMQRGLDPGLAAARLANDVTGLRAELLRLARVCGVAHPALVTPDHVELLDGTRSVPASEVFGLRGARALGDEDRRALAAAMASRGEPRPRGAPAG